MSVIGIICARGGSKGVPGKNIRMLGDKPLIAWTIDIARQCNLLDRVIVSTESPTIAEVAVKYGAEVPFMRPDELATDAASHWSVWRHAVTTLEQSGEKVDLLVDLHVTCPLRSVQDVVDCIRLLQQHPEADAATTITHSDRNPYFNMVSISQEGSIQVLIQPVNKITRRQDAPVAYSLTTSTYVLRRDFLYRTEGLFTGKVMGMIVPRERSFDIDTELDFTIVEALIAKQGR